MVFQRKTYFLNTVEKKGHIYKQILLVLLTSSGSITYGLQAGWISPMKKLFQSELSPLGEQLTDDEITWVATAFTITGFCLGLVHVYTADILGRKLGLLLVLFLQGFSWIVLLIPKHIAVLIFSRVCGGFAAVGYFMIVPMFIKEMTQNNIRGSLVTFCVLSNFIGVLSIYLMGNSLEYYTITWICFGFSVLTSILFMITATETPPFLVKVGKLEEATTILATLRGLDTKNKIIQDEMEYIKSQDIYFKTLARPTFKAIYNNKAWRRGFIICSLLMVLTNMNGVFTIINYTHSIVGQSNVTVDTEIQTLSVPILLIIGSIVPLTCIDRLGRKPILVGSYILCALSELLLATSLYVTKFGIVSIPGFVPVLALAVSVFAYAMGILCVPFLLLAEMFKFEVRAKLSGCIMLIGWFTITVQLHFSGWMLKIVDTYGLFYIFGVINIIAALFVLIFVPETKGRTPEQIEVILVGDNPDPDS